MSSYDGTFKILLLSDPEVDIFGFFLDDFKSQTIGVDFYAFTTNLRTIGVDFYSFTTNFNDKKVKLQIWDFSTEERFRFLLPQYCKEANVALLLYDITKSQTLNNIEELVNIVRQKSGDIPIMLGGVIYDEKNRQQVSAEEGVKIANSRNVNGYIELNLKTRKNVEEAFEALIRLILADKNLKTKKMKEYEEFIVYDLENTGDRTRLNIKPEELQNHLNPNKVLIIIRNDLKRIYIWKGSKSPVRKRFIASQVAVDLQRKLIQDSWYRRCKIISIDQGNELREFLSAFRLESMEVMDPLPDIEEFRESPDNDKDTIIQLLKDEETLFLEEFREIQLLKDEETKKKSDRDDDGDDRFPYPYIFKPPEPPDDFAMAPQVQLRAPLKEKDPEEEIYCQYCGRKLTKEDQTTHSCKKKPE